MVKITTMKIGDIKPDPDQPRKTFDEESIRQLAETFKTEGQIVPIEVDEDGVIVTGHRRWLAAKVAGLKEMDVIVREPENRLRRQLVEEFHRENIKPLERARAVRRLKREGGSDTNPLSNGDTARMLGIQKNRVGELLAMVEEPEIEKAIEEEKVEPTKAVELQKALGTEHAKEFIESHTKEEIEETTVHGDIRPLKHAPDKVKKAVASAEIDADDVASVVDIIPEDDDDVEDVVEELRAKKQAREFDEEEFRTRAERAKEGAPKTRTVEDRTRKAMDKRTLHGVVRRCEDITSVSIATVRSIKDDDLLEEAVQSLVMTYNHLKALLEGLGRFDATLPDTIDAKLIEGED